MDPKAQQSWEEFLNPEVMRPRLIAASIYIAGFEALKGSIINRIRDFYWVGFDESGEQIDPKYANEVLTRNRSPVYASLDWLRESEAIDGSDIEVFERVKRCRNRLAHDLLSVVGTEGLPADFDQSLADMVALLRKVEVWWIVNVEIPVDPDFDGTEEIDEAGILPGPVMNMQLLMEIALGDEEQSRFYYEEFRKKTGGGNRESQT
tara:strand:- start:2077 stop:2694 length:618 start_codon:yes stop_codon:yes gene_type:complete